MTFNENFDISKHLTKFAKQLTNTYSQLRTGLSCKNIKTCYLVNYFILLLFYFIKLYHFI